MSWYRSCAISELSTFASISGLARRRDRATESNGHSIGGLTSTASGSHLADKCSNSVCNKTMARNNLLESERETGGDILTYNLTVFVVGYCHLINVFGLHIMTLV